ncbi:MAG: tRNA lysidine(34) synthetase TilS [Bosea sp. (in: a-proteobacteria)]
MSGTRLTQDQGPVANDELEALFAPLGEARRILVAVSGGPDSVAALYLLARWLKLSGRSIRLSAATVDHHLRGAASTREAADVASLCTRMGVPHATLDWLGDKPAAGLPAAARAARYRLLLDHTRCIGATHLVTGHTLYDQAETLLMRMSRGSGLTGLAGMRAMVKRGTVMHARPFLVLPKTRLVATCEAAGLAFVADPTNSNAAFTRPRWRKLMPELAKEGLDSGRLGTLARRMARAENALALRADAVFASSRKDQADGCLTLDSGFLTQEPAEIGLRVLGLALGAVAPACSSGQYEARLERLESCQEALNAAALAGQATQRTLQNCILKLTARGELRIAPAPARHRGINENALQPRTSLGKAAGGA